MKNHSIILVMALMAAANARAEMGAGTITTSTREIFGGMVYTVQGKVPLSGDTSTSALVVKPSSGDNGKRVVIGSEHFIVEDEAVKMTTRQKNRIARELEGLSPLYLGVDGELVGAIGVEDPLKAGVSDAVAELESLGISRVIMLTGDNENVAKAIAADVGIVGQLSGEECFHSRICRAGNAAEELNTGCSEGHLGTAADAAANQRVRIQCRQNTSQSAVAAAHGVHHFGSDDLTVHHIIDLKLLGMTEVLENVSVFISNCDSHIIISFRFFIGFV